MPDTQPTPEIRHNTAKHRFETTLQGHANVVEYQLDGQVMRITHTFVHPSLEGRGLAGALVAAALSHARSEHLKVNPQCPYARDYMARHPETQDLLA